MKGLVEVYTDSSDAYISVESDDPSIIPRE